MKRQLASRNGSTPRSRRSPSPLALVAGARPFLRRRTAASTGGPWRSRRIQPKCACGGRCPQCRERRREEGASAGHPSRGELSDLLEGIRERRPHARLQVGEPDDVYEREADQVADQVLGMPDPAADPPTEGEASIASRTSARGTASADGPGGRGRPLPDSVRSHFSPRFGHDFGRVRIHTDARADAAARALDARAFTLGRDIVFRSGEYTPDTSGGRRLIAHELTHFIQQGEGRPAPGAPYGRGPAPRISATGRPDVVQRDFAIEPPHPDAEPDPLTPEEVQDAIRYNEAKLGTADPALISELRDVLGIGPQPADLDADFVLAVARWQAAYGLTEDGKLGPDTAAPLFAELRAEGLGAEATALGNLVRRARLKSGPTYSPNGTQTPTLSGGLRRLTIDMAAEFDHDPRNGIWASCGEMRQYIRWPPEESPPNHSGFQPAADFSPDTWYNDRSAGDAFRRGYRTGPFAQHRNGATSINRYLDTTGNVDFRNGPRYVGRDRPGASPSRTGHWDFKLEAIDVCNGNRVLGRDTVRMDF